MWNLGEPELLREEPLCGTLGKLNFKRGTFMWNLGEPELFRAEPSCRTLGKLE